jgi:CrcB protein
VTRQRVRADEVAAVAVGGVLGALARAWISLAVPHQDPASWPWATFGVNLLGCLLLGVLLDWIDARRPAWTDTHPRRARLARPLVASGVLGGFTTFSTFAAETEAMVRAGAVAAAVAYAVLSVVLGVALVLAGRALASTVVGRAPLDLAEDEAL